MKFKDLLPAIGLALISTFLIHKFFLSPKKGPESEADAVRSGQSFVAPKRKIEYQPLNREIDFIDEKRRGRPAQQEVETGLATYVFSSDGASLERLELKRKVNGTVDRINTVFPVGQDERENKCFLVAFNEKTPYYYTFVGKKETGSAIQMHYRYTSPASDVSIDKIYTVYKDTHKLDLKIDVSPKKQLEEGVQVRIFFPSPFTPEIQGEPSSVVVNESGAVERTQAGRLNVQQGWFEPVLFGADNKYFLHTMVEDVSNFVQRSYYRDASKEKLFSILEGPAVTVPTSWTLSFYFGPKEEIAMARVDERLFQTLEYSGMLSFISKPLLALIKFFYKYVGNYGLAIILLTLLIKLLFLPFTMNAEKGMKQRAELQRKLKYVEQKYKHDKEMLARAKADLIRKHGVTGLGSCLPLVLQLPIFFALSRVLSSSIEFYKAPFFGWITDLSASDPYYILPALMVIAMLLQAATGEPSQRFMMIAMALVFGAFLSSMSAGLVLYIAVSTLLGVAQTTVQKKLKAA